MMKFSSSVLAAIFCFAVVFASANAMGGRREPWERNPLVKHIRETNVTVLRQLRALRQNVRDTGCDINLGFVLQGDDFIDDADFEDQKNFVDLLVAILTTDKPGNYVAVQYGMTTSPITRITPWKRFFLRKVRQTKRVGGLETNIAAGLGYAGFQLLARSEDANAVIVLGDGLESVGFRPNFVAKQLRKRNVDVMAVAVGGYSISALTEMVGGDSNKVFEIYGFFELAEIVYGLVVDVCGFDL